MKKIPFVLILFLILTNYMFAQKGLITGRVIDAKTEEALVGANVVVNELENVGAATNADGYFEIKVPVGSYSIKASLIGYKPVVKTDVIVKTNSETNVIIKMSETSVEMDEVTVSADYFDKSIIENDLSTVVLGAEEVRRSPGSAQDFQRILQGMAGVSFSTDQTNELLVRGGSPDENLTVFDNMEIHSTNHYPNQYNSGGPINMINVDLIRNIEFSTGGFISKYGDKLSSVIDIETREGTRNNIFDINANLSMAGYGAVMEGRINGGKGSWVFSARKSYINLIAGSFGLTAIPSYYDLQSKVTYDLSKKHKLSFSGIYGDDQIDIEGETDHTNRNKSNSVDSVDIENVDVNQYQYAAGLNLKSIWSDNFYSILTLYKTNYNNDFAVTNDYTARYYNDAGEVVKSEVLQRRDVYSEDSNIGQTSLKSEFVWNVLANNEINFGGAVKFQQYENNQNIDSDVVRYDLNRDGTFDTTVTVQPAQLNYDFGYFDNYKSYFYVNDKLKLLNERLILNLGLHYDYFSYSEQDNLSPRFSASYYLVPSITSINLAYGEYYQTPPLPTFGDRYQSEVNRYLENSHARHYVLGFEHILSDGLKLNLEGYYKKYTDLPVSKNFVNFDNRRSRFEEQLTIGEKDAYGIDLLIQQKLVENYYGTISFSRMWSNYEDPRQGREDETYPSSYDFPYVITVIVGKRFDGLRSDLNDMPFFIKYPSMILPFSDDMEISLRWRYASGKPYTPQQYMTYEQHREGTSDWTDGWWVPSNEINSKRYPAYHRLDLAFNSRYNFSNWNLSIFLSIQNLYNRKNIAYYQYNSDETVDNVYQFAFMPVAGIEVEF